MIRRCVLLAAVALLALPVTRAADGPSVLPPAARRSIDFAADVRPIFAASCVGCHGPDKQRGGLRLDDGAAALRGGNSGAVLKPGDAADSRLLTLVAGLDKEARMPPEGKPALTAAQVGVLRAWVEQGAKWPNDGALTGQAARSSHWAFQPIRRWMPPPVKDQRWARDGLDAFVLARLEKEGLAPSPEADRLTLLRRVTFDLTGLPPTLEDVEAFINDKSPDAYAKVVDRLLASPHYGERWARHWLDLARYADSDGYEKDTGRPWAWRYRQWVIDALNRDLPYDQFIVEQLAADLLPNATSEQRAATGFHRNTLTNREGGVDQEQFRVEAVVDRVNTTAKVFLGLTLGCAQCHDHKYDPFSHREYYQFFAFFNRDTEADVPAPVPGDAERLANEKAAHEAKRKELQATVDDYQAKSLPAARQTWEAKLTLPELRGLPAPVREALLVEPAKRTPEQAKAIDAQHAKSDPKLGALNKALAAHLKATPQPTLAQTLALGPARPTHIHVRGDFLRKGIEVQPGTPAVLPPLMASATPTRLELARWIASPDHPLTPRVAVNWVWQKFLGRGLVATPEDFGTQGEKPSHSELLDYLANELVQQKWSLKALHRRIVLSSTYRQASQARPELSQRDPYNVLLARQARLRLEAESVRDAALAASGLLVRTVGGPSVRPPQPAGISDLTYAGSARWVESNGPDRYRRGLYTWFQRTSPYPMLMTFDAPDSNVCIVRRERSNSPLQALTLMNDAVFVECAQALGRRLAAAKGTPAARRALGMRLCVGRAPTGAEANRLARLHEELLALCRANPADAAKLAGKDAPGDPADAAAWVALARTLLNLDEFVTRE